MPPICRGPTIGPDPMPPTGPRVIGLPAQPPPRLIAAPPPCPPPPPPKPPWPPPPRCAKAAGAVPSNTTAQPATTSILLGFMAVLLTEGSASTSPMDCVVDRRVLVDWGVLFVTSR